MGRYDGLKMENQLCFPLYAAAKEVVRLYTPYLAELNLIYTQYIVMMLVWEKQKIAVKELVERLFLDTGTLTPLLKKLERKGLASLRHDPQDRRSVMAAATRSGLALRERAAEVPGKIGACVPLNPEEARTLCQTLYRILNRIHGGEQGGKSK